MPRWTFAVAAGLCLQACAIDNVGLGSDAGSTSTGEAATFDEPEAGSEDDATSSMGDGLPADDAPAPDSALGDGGLPDGAHPTDASGDAGSVSAACDQDGDGHGAISIACGGDDCCDSDAHVHPGQTEYFSSPGACGSFDYDCDGKDKAQFAGASCSWSSFACDGDGFAAPVPQCGDFGTFTSCSVPWYDVFTCNGSNASQAQACR